MPGLTLTKLLEIKDYLDRTAIKPYKGMMGLRNSGFFQINSEEEYRHLEEVLNGKEANSKEG